MSEFDNSPEEDDDDQPNIPGQPEQDPSVPLPLPEGLVPHPLTRDQIKRRLKAQLAIEADEIDTLFPDTEQGNKELADLYKNCRHAKDIPAEESSKDKQDTYKMSKIEKLALSDAKLAQRRRAKEDAEIADDKAREKFEKAGEHLPPKDRVSWSEAKRNMKALLAKKRKKLRGE
jgi:hypothetical protein